MKILRYGSYFVKASRNRFNFHSRVPFPILTMWRVWRDFIAVSWCTPLIRLNLDERSFLKMWSGALVVIELHLAHPLNLGSFVFVCICVCVCVFSLIFCFLIFVLFLVLFIYFILYFYVFFGFFTKSLLAQLASPDVSNGAIQVSNPSTPIVTIELSKNKNKAAFKDVLTLLKLLKSFGVLGHEKYMVVLHILLISVLMSSVGLMSKAQVALKKWGHLWGEVRN